MRKINILSVNISEKKGTVKHPVPSITLSKNGVEGDAHSGPWNRQVSLLGVESIRRFEQEARRKIGYGEFAENITTEGLELWKCQPLDRFVGEEFELEVTQIGKECHGSSCAIFKEVGNCVMPKEGIFARVKGQGSRVKVETRHAASEGQGGRVKVETRHAASEGQGPGIGKYILEPETTLLYQPKVFSAEIITLSDRAFAGEYEDRSGPRIRELLEDHFHQIADPGSRIPDPGSDIADHRSPIADYNYPASGIRHLPSNLKRILSSLILLPDDPDRLHKALNDAIAAGADFIFTTGGTGIGPRDVTPDVVKPLLDKEIPGIMERIRMKYGAEKHQALLSRSIAGVAGTTLIFTLPGSVRAVNEYMEEIRKSLLHMVYMVHGLDAH